MYAEVNAALAEIRVASAGREVEVVEINWSPAGDVLEIWVVVDGQDKARKLTFAQGRDGFHPCRTERRGKRGVLSFLDWIVGRS